MNEPFVAFGAGKCSTNVEIGHVVARRADCQTLFYGMGKTHGHSSEFAHDCF